MKFRKFWRTFIQWIKMALEIKNNKVIDQCFLTFFTSDPKRRNGKTSATQREKSYNYLILLKVNEGLIFLLTTISRPTGKVVATHRLRSTVIDCARLSRPLLARVSARDKSEELESKVCDSIRQVNEWYLFQPASFSTVPLLFPNYRWRVVA